MAYLDLVYRQASGALHLEDDQGGSCLLEVGYAGRGSGRNNPDAERQIAVGPIPRGCWRIAPAKDHARLGPCVFELTPVGHTANGRSGFFIHGDKPGRDASSGCIVIGRSTREAIRALGIVTLVVTI